MFVCWENRPGLSEWVRMASLHTWYSLFSKMSPRTGREGRWYFGTNICSPQPHWLLKRILCPWHNFHAGLCKLDYLLKWLGWSTERWHFHYFFTFEINCAIERIKPNDISSHISGLLRLLSDPIEQVDISFCGVRNRMSKTPAAVSVSGEAVFLTLLLLIRPNWKSWGKSVASTFLLWH